MAVDAPLPTPVQAPRTATSNGSRMSATKKPWRETPLVESANLSEAAGCRVFLKLDHLQPSGSFKSRGIGHYCQRALAASKNPSAVHFYSSSGGNAGLACVHAAKSLGRPCSVVVPLSTKPMMVAKIRAAGASEVVQEGKTWKDADGVLRESIMEGASMRGEEAVYVPPFDHEDVWAGNQTVVDEIEKQMGAMVPDVVICSVGGGGLFCGIVQGVERRGWGTEVLAVETQGAHSLNASLREGKLVMLDGITSQATSLGAVRVAERCFELGMKGQAEGRVKSAVFSDAEAAMGCWRFADDERMLVELACGVSLAPCYGSRLEKALGRKVNPDDKVVIIVCGGSNVTTQMVEGWRKEFGDLDAKASNWDVPSSNTAPNGS